MAKTPFRGSFPVVIDGEYSGTSSTMTALATWNVKGAFGRLRRVLVRGSTDAKCDFKLVIGNVTVFSDFTARGTAWIEINLGDNVIEHDVDVILYGNSNDNSTSIVASGILVGSEHFNLSELEGK